MPRDRHAACPRGRRGLGAAAAELAALPLEASCVECHEHEHESFRAEGLALDTAQHAGSGFPLEPPHQELECAACHEPALGSFDLRYPGRAPEECSRCHADPHAGQFADGPFALSEPGGECTNCHAAHEWEPPAFGPDEHARAGLPLDGAHLEVDCHDCHEIVGGGARVFRGTVSDCDTCHADPHRHFFAPFEDELALAEHGTCAACHLTSGFSVPPEHGFDHARFADFPLRGAHAQEDCEACHVPAEEPDTFGRSFGFVAEHFGRIESCASCHEDPHRGTFDGPGKPRRVEGRTGCARCHVEVSFRAFTRGFDHALWTGYELEDSHARLGCTDCHLPKDEPNEYGLTWGSALGVACADCHADPHAGQFEDLGGRTDCSRCHTPARFGDSIFRHDWDSTFELGEAHRDLACSACHPLEPHEGGAIVRYRPLKSDCIDCHGAQKRRFQLRKRGGK